MTSRSYYASVWKELKKSKLAMVSLGVICVVLGAAVYAPLICLDRPFWFSLPGSGEMDAGASSYPFFASLFDIRFFESGVDFFFNTAMVLSPFVVMAWFVLKKVLLKRRFRAGRFFQVVCVVQVVVFLLLVNNPSSNPAYDYKEKINELEGAGENPSYLFPILSQSFRQTDMSPGHPMAPSGEHLFGTDNLGRDLFARMLYGTRVSISVGVVAVGIYLLIGLFLGALAGYLGGRVDMVVSRLIEIMLCFPVFFLILTLTAFIEERSVFHIMIIIGLTSWTNVARLVRGEFIRERSLDYVQAAVCSGFSKAGIAFKEILPNALGPVFVSATFGIASAIVYESALAFLGLGDVSSPSWGGILAAGRAELNPRLILIPGLAIFILVTVFNLVGDALRDALDPKMRRR